MQMQYTDRQTDAGQIAMCRYASQATQQMINCLNIK